MLRRKEILTLFFLLACSGTSSQGNRAPRIEPIGPLTVQAGQLLSLDVVVKDGGKTPPVVTGEIRGDVLTGGIRAPFDQVEGVEFDPATGRLDLRVPPREAAMEIRIVATDGKKATLQDEEIVPVTVTPPNLFDGIRVDGVFDAFEADLILPSRYTVPSNVEMFDIGNMSSVGFIAVVYDIAADPDHIYLRITWEDATESRLWDLNVDAAPRSVDAIQILMDQDADGTLEDGEDLKMVFAYLTGSGYIDQHEDPASGDDPTVNGVGRMAYDPSRGEWTAELLIQREPDVHGHDADLRGPASVPFNILFVDSMGSSAPATYAGGLYGFTTTDASGWGDLPIPPDLSPVYAPPARPTLGTFICISAHEDPNGEIYELDLGTGALQRLTTNSRYEDWVSVAPDGSFAAYGSSTGQNDFSAYEIYKWERSTGQETALTSDNRLDGHPGISPDNQRIVYVKFNILGTADFYIMDRDGGGVVRITNDNIEENDPEWSRDGRLAIKSTRWTGNEVMAIMDEDGSNLIQLTDHAYSDHDGMVSPDNRWILYERFESSVVWNSDWNLTNSTPWTIRMVSLDGSEHRLLVDLPLVAWLPVMGPDGIIAYFHSTGFNGREVRMIDRFGVDRGRLAPIHSSIRYMDWK